MNNTSNLIRLAIIFGFALLLQIIVFDNVDFLGLCNPFFYVVFLISVPVGCPTALFMVMAFALGFAVDLSANTPGMHAAACVLVAYLRQFILKFLAFRSAYKDDDMPDLHVYGSLWFFKFMLALVSIHHVALFLIEQYDSFFFLPTLIRTFLSIIATSICIILFELAAPRLDSSSSFN